MFKPIVMVVLILATLASLWALLGAGTRALLLGSGFPAGSLREAVGVVLPASSSPFGQRDIVLGDGQRFVLCTGIVGHMGRPERERCAHVVAALQGKSLHITYVDHLLLPRHVVAVSAGDLLFQGTSDAAIASQERMAALLFALLLLFFGGTAALEFFSEYSMLPR